MKNDLIHSEGDTSRFGKITKAIEAQCRVPDNHPMLDFSPILILKAKDFATETTIHKVLTQTMSRKKQISQEYFTNCEAVRQILLNQGIRPGHLPPAKDVKKVERRLASDAKKGAKKPLWAG